MRAETGGNGIAEYLGANLFTVREWISSRFVEGMNWNNYGTIWQVDHIVPLRLFDLSKEDDLKIVWHYKNLMPLMAEDNLNKEGNLFFAYILLTKVTGSDFFYQKLLERIEGEIDRMNKYIQTYHGV